MVSQLQTFCEGSPIEKVNGPRVYDRLNEVNLNICTENNVTIRDEKWKNWAKEHIKKNAEEHLTGFENQENHVNENNVSFGRNLEKSKFDEGVVSLFSVEGEYTEYYSAKRIFKTSS